MMVVDRSIIIKSPRAISLAKEYHDCRHENKRAIEFSVACIFPNKTCVIIITKKAVHPLA